MPNEMESTQRQPWSINIPEIFSSVLKFLKEHITIEEIILVALIILLIDEPVDQDIFIILLIYILLF